MKSYRLTPAAQDDFVRIRDYYLEEAGYKVARRILIELVEAFRFLARSPGAGHKREDLAESRPILFWSVRDFLILYEPGTNPLSIVSILRASQDIAAVIQRRRLGAS